MPRNPAFLSQSGGLLRRLGLPALASLALLASSALAPTAAHAAVPALVTIEGVLTASGSTPAADGFYNITFAVFKDAAGGNPLWTEGPVQIALKNGVFAYSLGSKTPLTASVLSGLPSAYLSMQIASDAELPRQPLVSVAYALRAAVAEGLECSGCVGASALDPQALAAYAKTTDLSGYAKSASLAKVATSGAFADLTGGPDLSAYAKTSGLAKVATSGAFADLSGGPDLTAYAKSSDLSAYVKASSLAKVAGTGAYADLSGLPVEAQLGKTCGTGLVMNGINADGSYACIASAIAGDMIDEISNGLIWNQFVDSTAGAVGTKIPDGLGAGVTDTLNFPDIGQAQKIWVNVAVANSDLSGVKIELYGPGIANPYVLYSGGKTGTALTTNFNTDLPIVSGDMNKDWVGQNIKGAWSITVKDLKAGGGTGGFDGTFSWAMNIQTLSNQKIQIKGNLIVDKDVTVGGNLNVTGTINASAAGAANNPYWPTLRWGRFSTYDQNGNWYYGNTATWTLGVAPSTWTDGSGRAWNITADKNYWRTVLVNKENIYPTMTVMSEAWYDPSSTNGKVLVVLFRIKNTTGSAINWSPAFWHTNYGGWGECSSVTLNGASTWDNCGTCYAWNCQSQPTLSIPANRISSAMFVIMSGPSSGNRSQLLTFYSDTLKLPTGLQYVDDLDTASGDWSQ